MPRRSRQHQVLNVGADQMQAPNLQMDDRSYRGVTFYKRTGRWEANLWYENRQHYLGASCTALEAARAYDKAILFCRLSVDQLNFNASDYADELAAINGKTFPQFRQYLRDMSKEPNCEIVSRSFKGIVIDQRGRWEVKYLFQTGPKPLYLFLGFYDTEESALRAYNETAVKHDPMGMISSFHEQSQGSRALTLHPFFGENAALSHEILDNDERQEELYEEAPSHLFAPMSELEGILHQQMEFPYLHRREVSNSSSTSPYHDIREYQDPEQVRQMFTVSDSWNIIRNSKN